MRQRCKKCGRWNGAQFIEKSPFALGRFIDNLVGYEYGAKFECECGNKWIETNKQKDEVAEYFREIGKSEEYIKNFTDHFLADNKKSHSSNSMLSDETKENLIHAVGHIAQHLLK